MQVTEVFFQFAQRFALRQIIGEPFKIAKPHLPVLPANVTRGAHKPILQPALPLVFHTDTTYIDPERSGPLEGNYVSLDAGFQSAIPGPHRPRRLRIQRMESGPAQPR